jgi:hypothetical protein
MSLIIVFIIIPTTVAVCFGIAWLIRKSVLGDKA